MHADRLGQALRVARFEAFKEHVVPAGRLEKRSLVTRRPKLRAMGVDRAAGEDLLERLETGESEQGQVKGHVELDQREGVVLMGRLLHLGDEAAKLPQAPRP